MADGTFDGIIVGGGYNGLTLGGYMARQGLRVLVLERRMAYGGGGGGVPVLLSSRSG